MAGALLAACSTRQDVAPFPDVRYVPQPPTTTMSVQEKDAAIQELQNAGHRNNRLGF